MCCWSSVNHQVLASWMEVSETNRAIAINTTGRGTANASSGSAWAILMAKPTISGRRGRIRSASTLPTSPPMAPPVRMKPHAAAPPNRVSGTTGPRGKIGADALFVPPQGGGGGGGPGGDGEEGCRRYVRHGEGGERGEQPRARRHLAPPLGQIGQESPVLCERTPASGDAQHQQRNGADRERGGIP